MDKTSLARAKARKLIYERNKELVRQWKESHPCSKCNLIFPHYLLSFVNMEDGSDPIAKLIINRPSVKRLQAALEVSPLLCANHLAEWRHFYGKQEGK